MKKIALMEPNDFHGEVVAGLVGYFVDIGYMCDVYLRSGNYAELEGIKFGPSVKLIRYQLDEAYSILNSEKMQEYDFVFFTSMELSLDGDVHHFLKHIGCEVKSRYGVMGMYHTTSFIRFFKDEEMARQGRLFCISDFQKNVEGLQALSPSYFYFREKCVGVKRKNRPVKILSLGSMMDYEKMAQAYFKLSKAQKKELVVVHSGGPFARKRKSISIRKVAYAILAKINPKYYVKEFYYAVEEAGRLSFSDLLDLVEDMDYLFFRVDYHGYDGMHYLSLSTSGSKQMALAMNILPICTLWTSELYGFKDCSVTFDNDLHGCFERILSMTDEEHETLLAVLERRHQQVYQESIDVLKNTIERICGK